MTHMAVKPTQPARDGADCAVEVPCVILSARLIRAMEPRFAALGFQPGCERREEPH